MNDPTLRALLDAAGPTPEPGDIAEVWRTGRRDRRSRRAAGVIAAVTLAVLLAFSATSLTQEPAPTVLAGPPHWSPWADPGRWAEVAALRSGPSAQTYATGSDIFVQAFIETAPLQGSFELSRFDLRTRSWRSVPPLEGSIWASFKGMGDEVVAFDGENLTAVLDATGRSWRPMPLSGFAMVTGSAWTGSELVVVGRDQMPVSASMTCNGPCGPAPPPRPDPPIIRAYSPSKGTWRRLATPPVEQISTFDGIAWMGREVVALPRDLGQPLLYDPGTDTWRKGAASPFGPAHTTAWSVAGDLLVLNPPAERERGERFAVYDPASDAWRTVPDPPDVPWPPGSNGTQRYSTAGVADGHLLLRTPDPAVLLVLDVSTGGWTTMPSPPGGYSSVMDVGGELWTLTKEGPTDDRHLFRYVPA